MYEYENENLKLVGKKENEYDDFIFSFIQMDDGTIIIGERDNLIKLWDDWLFNDNWFLIYYNILHKLFETI